MKCSEAFDALGQFVAQDKIVHYLVCPYTRYLLHDQFGASTQSDVAGYHLLRSDARDEPFQEAGAFLASGDL